MDTAQDREYTIKKEIDNAINRMASAKQARNKSNQNFLEAPDLRWDEREAEQVIALPTNVAKYLHISSGQVQENRDIVEILERDAPEASADAVTSNIRLALDIEELWREPELPAWRRSLSGVSVGRSSPYSSLNGESEIRILEILPGVDTDIVCDLHVVAVDDVKGTYEALSYTWDIDADLNANDMAPTSPEVLCNGFRLPVKPNLYYALLALRHKHKSRLIWADALCIDQSNTAERSHQVTLMTTIFKNAFRVIVWVGQTKRPNAPSSPSYSDSSDEATLAFFGICSVVNAWIQRSNLEGEASFASLPSSRTGKRPETRLPDLSIDSEIWRQILALYECRWFTRLWVVQEVLLARSAVVIWGTQIISWEVVGLAASIIRSNYNKLKITTEGAVNETRGSTFWSLDTSTRDTRRERGVPTGVLNAYFMYRMSNCQQYSQRLPYPFHQLLSLTRQFRCSDPRDRVFALMGVALEDDIAHPIRPDYNKSVAEVYTDVARLIIAKTQSLNSLCSIQRPAKGTQQYDEYISRAPSWVPQWQISFSRSLAPLTREQSFKASGDVPAMGYYNDDQSRLIIKGILVGTARNVTAFPAEVWRRENETLGIGFSQEGLCDRHTRRSLEMVLRDEQWTTHQLQTLAVTLTGGKNWYGLPVANVDAHLADFARCLLKGGLIWTLRIPKALRYGCSSGVNGAGQLGATGNEQKGAPTGLTLAFDSPPVTFEYLYHLAEHGKADRFLDASHTTCHRRVGFATDTTFICVGPEAMQEGDRICIIYGADMPFVVRRLETGWLIIGECYVRDFMQGQAVQRMREGEAGFEEVWMEMV